VKVQSALTEEVALIRSSLEESAGVERVIHLQTMHVGPDELLVAAKIAIHDSDSGTQIAKAINDAEIALRTALPSAKYTFLEPDLDFGRQGDSTVHGLKRPRSPALVCFSPRNTRNNFLSVGCWVRNE